MTKVFNNIILHCFSLNSAAAIAQFTNIIAFCLYVCTCVGQATAKNGSKSDLAQDGPSQSTNGIEAEGANCTVRRGSSRRRSL